uniref:LPXTG cell wall anchor domain-containing protein n=1 Tax=uncultured Erythrobacter sp. TaxID=263913 RepID=UPI00262BE016|nr:LPXTG cell wall anchor domain-containing protein [uncultured Erythrobacter sp.]
MRAPQNNTFPANASRSRSIFSALALCAGSYAILAAPLSAQETPRDFSLPDPTPTPTSAPQGPVDIRNGVVIGPRRIEPEPTIPTPTPTPSASEAAAPTPAPPQSAAPATTSASPAPSRSNTAPTSATTTPRSDISDAPQTSTAAPPAAAQTDAAPVTEAPSPGFGEDGVYSSIPDISSDDPAAPSAAPVEEGSAWNTSGNLLWIGLAGLLALLGGLGWWMMRRRKEADRPKGQLAAPALAAGAREFIAKGQRDAKPMAAMPPPSPTRATTPATTPAPTPAPPVANTMPADQSEVTPSSLPPAAPQFALQLDIVSAARSVMMLTVDYHLNIANRSDRALRDFAVNASLICARRGSAAGSAVSAQPLQLVERIGPHQSRAISGKLQLPLSEISPLRQGRTPVIVPLIELTIETSGYPARTHKFVVGMPSAANAAKLHPIPLDNPPGGLPGLRTKEIKDAPEKQSA